MTDLRPIIYIASIVIFVVTAILAFWANTSFRDLIGLLAVGLACLALAATPVPTRPA